MAKKKRTTKAPASPVAVEETPQLFNSPESSTIAGAFYDHGTLVVLFKRGADRTNDRYDYPNVPESLWLAFKAAESKGAFFTQQIRPHYQGRKHGE